MAQDEDLDLVGGVGAGAQHHLAQQLREHLVDQPHRHLRIMPCQPQQRRTRSAVVREVSGTHRLDLHADEISGITPAEANAVSVGVWRQGALSLQCAGGSSVCGRF